MGGGTRKFKGVLADFPTAILPNISGYPLSEALIEVHWFISGNVAPVASNLGGGRHGHLAIKMTADDYMVHTGYTFVQPHNPGDYPPSAGAAQEQALGTKRFRKIQALFIRCTAVEKALKDHIVAAVQPVFLSSLVDQLTGFLQVSVLQFFYHLYNSFGEID